MSIKITRTHRGAPIGEFTDCHDHDCSIQSLGDGNGLWLGRINVNPKYMVPFQGWTEVDFDALLPGKDVSVHSRMLLTRDMVRELLPLLQHFADTGDLPVTP